MTRFIFFISLALSALIMYGLTTMKDREQDKGTLFFLVQVNRDFEKPKPNGDTSEEWSRVVKAGDSIGAKINMIQWLERVYPADGESILHDWIIRRIDFNSYKFGVAKVRVLNYKQND